MKIYTTLLSNGLDNLITAKEVHVSLISCQFSMAPNETASFTGLAQLSFAYSTKKQGETNIFFSHEHDVIGKWQNLQNLLGVFRIFSPDYMLNARCIRWVASR